MFLFRHKIYTAVTFGHFTIDVFNNTAPVLITFLAIPMALTAAQIGMAIGLYQLMNAIAQPMFGWVVDKIGSQILGGVSVAWTVGFISVAVFVAQQTNNFALFLIPFSLAALGSSAFHPMGTMHASTAVLNRAATGTAVFFLFGQVGLASGPAIAGLILEVAGLYGIYLMALVSLPVLIFIAYSMRDVRVMPHTATDATPQTPVPARVVQWEAIGILAMLTGLRSWVFLGTVAFLPKLFQDMGWTAGGYGLITGIYWMASAIAGVVAGHFADRFGRRQVIFVTLTLGSVMLYFVPLYSGWTAFLVIILAGGLLGASHSIIVVTAQALLPGRKAFASGVTLGYIFGVGAIAIWSIGLLAEIWTLPIIIQLGSGLGILSGAMAWLLPSTTGVPQPQPEGSPA